MLSKANVLILSLLLAVPSWAKWITVQDVVKTGCTTGTATCTVSNLANPRPGDTFVYHVYLNAADGGTTISSVSNETGVFPAACAQTSSSTGGAVKAGYTLSILGTITGTGIPENSVTVTMSGNIANAWEFVVSERRTTSPPAIFDTPCTALDDSVSQTPQPGPAPTISGRNEDVFQFMASGPAQKPTAIGSPYTYSSLGVNGGAFADAPNSAYPVAPSWTMSAATKAAALSLAIKETDVPATVIF